jgi:hypothetical protein
LDGRCEQVAGPPGVPVGEVGARAGEGVPLGLVDAERCERVELVGRLYSFSGDGGADVVGKQDQGGDQGPAGRVRVEVVDELAVELDDVAVELEDV